MTTSKVSASKKSTHATSGAGSSAAVAAPQVDVAATAPVHPSISSVANPPAPLPLPPANNIPKPPDGFVATNGADYRGVTPKKAELAVLPQALVELGKFTEYASAFGKAAPPLATLQQVLEAALLWSQMRNSTSVWDLYSRTMEGLTWIQARLLMERLSPTFAAATAADASIATQNPSLTSLLNAAKVIAQRGAATRKANAKSKANGEPPVRGKAAAKVKRAAKVVAAAGEVGAHAAHGGASAPPAPVDTPAPVASAPPVAAAPAVPPTNGAAH